MRRYCKGSVSLKGDKNILDLISTLLYRLDDCAEISGFDANDDWLPHIFKKEYMLEGIFYEGYNRLDSNRLEVYIRAFRTNGHDFFQAMASGLGLMIKWEYISDYDGDKHIVEFKPIPGQAKWELRTEEELDGDLNDAEVSTGSTNHYASIQELSRIGEVRSLKLGPSEREYLEAWLGSVLTKQDIEALWNEVYQHLVMVDLVASPLSAASFVDSDLYNCIRARICADVYIATELALKATCNGLHGDDYERVRRYADALESLLKIIRAGFGCTYGDLMYSSFLIRDIPYDVLFGSLSFIKEIAKRVPVEAAINIASVSLPVGLW